MKYIPKPTHAIIQLIEPTEKPPKPGCLILPNALPSRHEARVLAVGKDMGFLQVDDVVLYNKYNAVMIDEDEKIYSIPIEGVICLIEQDEEELT